MAKAKEKKNLVDSDSTFVGDTEIRPSAVDSGFRAPFQILILVERECAQHLAELNVTSEEIQRDTLILLSEINAKHQPYQGGADSDDRYLAIAISLIAAKIQGDTPGSGYWPLIACNAALYHFKRLQTEQNHSLNASAVRLALFAQFAMNAAWKPKRMQEIKRLANQFHGIANQLMGDKTTRIDHLKTGQKKQAAERAAAARNARKLVTETVFPEWRKANLDASKADGYRHCATVLTRDGYKNANGAAITGETVKAYFRKPREKSKHE